MSHTASASIGVVACESLYSQIERLVPGATVRYVSPTRHEFPTNVPDDEAIAAHLQAHVDDLDDPSLDRIVVSYANSSDGLTGLRSTHAPLVVSRADDCTSALLAGPPGEWGERKAFGTYYLTRGWIDCAVDSYKLYRGYLGESEALRREFDRAADAHPDMRVTWAESDAFQRAIEKGQTASPGAVDRFFHEIVQYYETIALVDTGDLYECHHDYADRFRSFVERLARTHGDERSVKLDVVDGDDQFLRALLTADDHAQAERIDVYPPGAPVE